MVSPELSWSRLPSPRFPHCQHPFLFLFLSIPQSYFCTGEKWGGCMTSARATPGRDRKSIGPFYCPTALTCGKVGTLPSGAATCGNILGIWTRMDQRLLLIHLSSGAMVP